MPREEIPAGDRAVPSAGGQTGIGYTYGDAATAALADSKLASAVRGADAMAPPAAWRQTELSGHCVPAVSAHACCAVKWRDLERFRVYGRSRA